MQSVKIRNMETEECVWLNIPSSYQTVREVFAGLGDPETVQIVSAEGQGPVLEKHLAGKVFRRENGVNELEFLDLRMEGMTRLEKEIFLAALEIEKPYTLMEIVNLSCNLDKFIVYHGAADEALLGNYILEHRKDALEGYAETQGEMIGRRYAGEHAGCFSESGYIFRSGEAVQDVYDGEHCPDPAYDRGAVFMVTISRERVKGSRRTLSLALPASDEKLAVAAGNLGIADVGECVPLSICASDWSLTSHLPMSYDIRGLNDYARLLHDQNMTGRKEVMKKLYAALEAELPASMDGAIEIAGNLERYRFLPEEAGQPSAYARYVLKDWMAQADRELDRFIDFNGYGAYRMRADGVVQTGYGVLARTDRPIPQLPEEVRSFKLFSPLRGIIYPYDDCGEISDQAVELDSCELEVFEDFIREMLEKERRDLKGGSGLAAYISNCLLKRKVVSMMPSVENWRDEMWGVLEVNVHGKLTDGELNELIEEWTGQASDGWGESFEQQLIEAIEGELYVSFWHSGSGFFIKTEEELKSAENQTFTMQIGGVQG